jgi:putative MATE family efflux protein
MDRTKQLGTENIGKLLLNFSLPPIIGMMAIASYNIVDRIFVGNGVGPLGISGVAITYPLYIIYLAFSMLIGIGATAMVSIKLGENNKEAAEKYTGNAFTLVVIIAILLMVFGYIFMEPMLKLFGASGIVMEYAKQYTSILLIGGVFQNIAFAMNNLIRGQGDPKTSMLTMLISAVINTILNPIFIFGFHMGVRGSATATLISQFVSCIWVLWYFRSKRSYIKIHFRNLKLDKKIVMGILAIGVSPFALQISSSVVITLFNNTVNTYGGELGIAAMGIGYSIFLFIMMPVFGLNQGVQPIIGFNYGAHQYARVLQALKKAIQIATMICTVGFIGITFFAGPIISVFSKNDPTLMSMGTRGLRIFLFTLPIIGFQVIGSSYFQAVGKPIQAIMLTVTRQLLIVIPMILILPHFFQLDGVWLSGPVSDTLTGIFSAFLLIREVRLLKALDRGLQNPV